MRRKLFTIAAGVSAVLCIAVCVLWVRSLGGYDLWEYQPAGDKLYNICSVHSDVFFASVDRKPSFDYPAGFSHGRHPVPKQWVSWTDSSPKPARTFRAFGIGYIGTSYGRKLVLAYWLLLGLSLVLPALWLRGQWLARRLDMMGRCPACGYDLRATTDRCPECGAVPASKPSSS